MATVPNFHFFLKLEKKKASVSELPFIFSYLCFLFTWFCIANTTAVRDKHTIYKMKSKELCQLERERGGR